MNTESLGEIKAWSGLANNKDSIKRLKVKLKLVDALAEVSRMDQYQRIKKMEANGYYDGPCSKGCTKTSRQGW